MTASKSITPVILSGGAGTRLWPMSRALYPKQLLPLVGENSLLQDTALRVAGDGYARPLVICNDSHRFVVAENLRALEIEAAGIMLEPVGRNTAPAAAVAALHLAETAPGTVMLLMPSDHAITKTDAFHAAIETAAEAARGGALVTFGITPDRPETGYGYIKRGKGLAVDGAFAVERFVEKPDARTAAAYVSDGEYLWNSGIFAFTPERFLAELERLEPAMVGHCRDALARARSDLDFQRLDTEAFSAIDGQSIDYAVMEHTADAAVVPVDMGWSDVGSWSALWDIGTKDVAGNVSKGDVIAVDTYNSYIRTDDGQLVAVVGLDDVVVVVTDDAIMVADKARTQDVKEVVARLDKAGRTEHKLHSTVHRPWGCYRGIDVGDRFQVKRITVSPGASLSLQKHHHRAEHWVVVRGTAKVTRGEETFLLHEDQSTYIPIGVEHRLENPGKLPVHLIEVQTGAYLGEDDIVRLEDTYGRK